MAFLGVKVCTIALTAPFMKVRTDHLFKGKGRALVGSDEVLLGFGVRIHHYFRIVELNLFIAEIMLLNKATITVQR